MDMAVFGRNVFGFRGVYEDERDGTGGREFEVVRGYMDDTRNILKIIGTVLLGLFAVVVGIPLILAALGVVAVTSLVIFAKLVGLAILAIKLAVVVAVIYLVVVGIRALLK